MPNEDRDGHVILPALAVDDRKLTIRHPNYNGAFNLRTGTGRARIAPTFPSFNSLVRGFLAATLPLNSGLVLHAAAVVRRDAKAIVFAGASGSGKTTLARHFLKTRPRPLTILSDELIPVRAHPIPHAFGSPFWGDLRSEIVPGRTRNNVSAPIHKLVFLQKGKRNGLRPLSRSETVARLLKCTLLHSHSKAVLAAALSTAQALAASCSARSLEWTSLKRLTEQAHSLTQGACSRLGASCRA